MGRSSYTAMLAAAALGHHDEEISCHPLAADYFAPNWAKSGTK
jgi:hypothetical protein